MRDNGLRKKFNSGEKALGLWSALGSEVTLEMAATFNFDWVLIDCEHGVAGYEQLPGLLRALGSSRATSLVRVPTKDDPWIFKRVLDAGVEGVLVPQIYTADDVRAVVNACRYPPQGERGIAAGRAHQYGTDFMDTLQRSNEEVLVLVQIETREAVDNVDEILAVPGLDGILIGPADLSAALGHTLDFKNPEVIAAFEKIRMAGDVAGKPVGFFCNSPRQAKARLAEGYQFVNICHDGSLILQGYTESLAQMKEE